MSHFRLSDAEMMEYTEQVRAESAALEEAMRAMAFPCKAKDVHPNHDVCECCHAKFIAIRALKRCGK